MAPVALYPDPIISILLPAATFPSDIALAASYLNGGGDPGQADSQPWDPSVRSLAHYPDVVKWMAQNEPWTQAVGAAFVSQPSQVMEAIQRLRALARAAGTLANTPQQQVIVDNGYVEIEPAQPNVIYIPRYDSQVVYVDQPYDDYNGPYFAYGPPYEAGVWLTYGCNWGGGGVVVVDSGYWRDDRGWRHDPYAVSISLSVGSRPRPWGFPSGRPRPQAPAGWRQSSQIVNARPIAGAPPRPPQAASRNIHTTGPAAVAAVGRNPAAFTAPAHRAAASAGSGGPIASPQRQAQQSPPAQRPEPEREPARPSPVNRAETQGPARTEPKAPAEAAAPSRPEAREPAEAQHTEPHVTDEKSPVHPAPKKESKPAPERSAPDKDRKDDNPH
jgi:hypothetical protein